MVTPFLTFQVHRVQDLLGGIAVGNCAGQVQQPVSQGGLAVVDMSNDAKIADVGCHSGESIPDFLPGEYKGLIREIISPTLTHS